MGRGPLYIIPCPFYAPVSLSSPYVPFLLVDPLSPLMEGDALYAPLCPTMSWFGRGTN